MPRTEYGEQTWDDLSRAVSMVESAGGANITPRYESRFQEKYLQGKPQWEALAQKYGWQRVSASYGAHQIMYPVAVELGYKGPPEGLEDPKVNRLYFEKKFGRDLSRNRGNLQKTLKQYNGGGDPEYVSHVLHHLLNPPPVETEKTMSQPTPSIDPIEQRIRHINRMSSATGFGPLTVQEIHGILRKVVPPPAVGAHARDNDGAVGNLPPLGGPRQSRGGIELQPQGEFQLPHPEDFTFQYGMDRSGATPSLGIPMHPVDRFTAKDIPLETL